MDILTDRVSEIRCDKCGLNIPVQDTPSFSEVSCPGCGTRYSVPARLNGFLLTSLLGKGGMGAVYQAVDESLGRRVAVKVMLKALGEDRKSIETFRKEAQAAAALNHPNIAQIHVFGEEKGQPYIVMELLTGGRLDQMIAKAQSLDEWAVLRIGMGVAEGLKAANDIGLVHGDIKPENILLDANGVAKVVDFGLASFLDKAPPSEGVWGTPYYIAPEKARGQRGDARSDIYSLGATLYHVLAGQPPFEGKTPVDVIRARIEQPPPKLSAARPGIHPELEVIVTRMLQPDPAMRYPTYASLLADMRKLLDALPARTKMPLQSKKLTGKASLVVSAGDLSAYRRRLQEQGTVPGRPEPKRRSLGFRVCLWIVFSAAVITGSVFGVMQYLQWRDLKHNEQDRGEALQQAMKKIGATYSAIQSGTVSALARAADVDTVARQATQTVAKAAAQVAASDALKSMTDKLPDLGAIRDAAAAAQALAATNASTAQTLVAEATDKTVPLKEAVSGPAAQRMGREFDAISSNIQAAAQAIERAHGEAEKSLKDAKEAIVKLGSLEKAASAAVAQAAAEKAAAERKAAEEAAAARKEEARKALIAQETEKVKTAREANANLVKTLQYGEALTALLAATGGLQTDEGKEAVAVASRRLTLLRDMKTFVIRQLTREPYRWGWQSGGSQADVVSADEANVALKGRSVPWVQVSSAQMFRFIQHYLTPAALPQKPDLARMTLAAGLFCEESGGAKQAADYARQACDLDPTLRADVKKLMPEVNLEAP